MHQKALLFPGFWVDLANERQQQVEGRSKKKRSKIFTLVLYAACFLAVAPSVRPQFLWVSHTSSSVGALETLFPPPAPSALRRNSKDFLVLLVLRCLTISFWFP